MHKKCPPEDAELAKSIGEMARGMMEGHAPAPGETRNQLMRMLKATDAWFDKHKDTGSEQESVLAYQFANTVQGSASMVNKEAAAPLALKIKQGMPGLLKRFPNSAGAHALQGFMLLSADANSEKVIAEFKRCLELNAQEKYCQRGYDTAVKRYEQGFCAGPAVSGALAFYLSRAQKEPGFSRKLEGKDENIFVGKTPALNSRHVARVQISEENNDYGDGVPFSVILLELTASGAKKLAEITEKNIGKYFTVAVGNAAVLNARINTRISDGKVAITLGGEAAQAGEKTSELLGKICHKVTRHELPSQLKWPAAH